MQFNQLNIPVSESKKCADASIIYIHGIGGSYAVWYFNYILQFYGKYHQIAYDMRGHGESDYPKTGYNVSNHADDLKQIANQVNVFQQKRCFIGYSYGGCVLIDYAARHATADDKIIILDAPFVKRIDQQVIDDLYELRLALLGEVEQPKGYLATEFKATMGDMNPEQRGITRYAKRLEKLFATGFPTESINNTSPSIAQLEQVPCEVVLLYAQNFDCLSFGDYLNKYLPNCRYIKLDAKHDLITTHCEAIREQIEALILE
jgi:pimeloyl-ACP methyl ester carboxylesterase